MCGLAGYINLKGAPASNKIITNMTSAIAHRGPDDEGYFVYENIALGHRRLSIIDLSRAGHQPMLSKDNNFVLVYNGEIYNFQEIRLELEVLGYTFRSNTDSEVVLQAYIHWKEECVTKFNGMFAFVIYDKMNQSVFIARDRYGIKPLYYSFQNGIFMFASEQKALMQHPEFSRKVDGKALIEYFTFQNLFTERNFFDEVKTFPSGHVANFKMNEGSNSLDIREYWDYCFQESNEAIDEKEAQEQLGFLFKQAVSRQLVSDVELGTYLSGGMDSGSITAVVSEQLPLIKTFTCGFDIRSASGIEVSFDEREKAEYLSYLYQTEHYEMVLKSGDMERCLPSLAWHLETPRVGQSYPNYYASKLASRFVKVALAGTAGDELFAGYPWRYYRAVNNTNFNDYILKYYSFWQRMVPQNDMQNLFEPIWGDVKVVDTRDIFSSVFDVHAESLHTPEEYINHSLYFEAKTFLHGLLMVEDKLSMAHSLETRVPFLDNDLVDFAQKLPVKMKLNNLTNVVNVDENIPGNKTGKYFEKTKDGKRILRSALENYLPSDFTQAIKQGFSAPDATWFKGESIDYVKRVIYNDHAMIYQFLSPKLVRRLVEEHLQGKINRRLLIWSFLNFEEWLQQMMGGR